MITSLELAACRQPSRERSEGAASPQKPVQPLPPPFTTRDAAVAVDTLKRAPDHGFPAKRFHADEIEQLLNSSSIGDQIEGKGRLRAAVLDYARAQHGLTVPVGALPRAWNQRPSTYDAGAELNAALREGTLQAWLDGLPPQTPDYRALQAAYVAAKTDRAERIRPRVEGAPLGGAEQGAPTKALRRPLAREGPVSADGSDGTAIDQDLIAAPRAYQAQHQLEEAGGLDAATAERPHAPVMSKAAKLRVNMERLRWLPRPEPGSRIDVNIAAAEMDYFRDGELTAHMLAVSGKLGDETPIVSSAIGSIVLNPPWYVPTDLARREIIPKGAVYMKARHFVWRSGRLIQRPGPKAALGLVKFDFPNPYAVYLHDTPSKATVSQAQRAASHGCVRLQHAVGLARLLAADEPGMSAEQVNKILSSGKTVRLKLARPVPVRLIYLTAEPKGGSITYLPDVYGWDAKLLTLLDRYQAPRRRP